MSPAVSGCIKVSTNRPNTSSAPCDAAQAGSGIGVMHLDLTDADTLALLNLLVETIEADRYPMSPLFRRLQDQDGWVRAAQTFGIRAPTFDTVSDLRRIRFKMCGRGLDPEHEAGPLA